MGNNASEYNQYFTNELNKAGLIQLFNDAFQPFVPGEHCLQLYKMVNDPSSHLYNDESREKIQAMLDVMIFFLPIKNNTLFVAALRAAESHSEGAVSNFSKALLEKGSLMVDSSGDKKDNPLYDHNAEALLHLARLKNLIDQQVYFSALGALGVMESYSNLLPKRNNHPISYQAVMTYCSQAKIQHPDLFYKLLRYSIMGTWDNSKEPIRINIDTPIFKELNISEDQIKEICAVIGIDGKKLLAVLEPCKLGTSEANAGLYTYAKMGQLLADHMRLKDMEAAQLLAKFLPTCNQIQHPRARYFILCFMHPRNFYPVNPTIIGFNIAGEGLTLSKDALTYVKGIFEHFDLSATEQQSLINELLALPAPFSVCYKLSGLGAKEAAILQDVAKPWLKVGDVFYYPSVEVFYSIMTHVTRAGSVRQPTQFLTGMVGSAALEQMVLAGFRPSYVYSSFCIRNPVLAHAFAVKPCMYTMHDVFYHLPKFFISQDDKNNLKKFAEVLSSVEHGDQFASKDIRACIDILYDGDLILDKSNVHFHLEKGFTAEETNLLVIMQVLEPLVSHASSEKVQENTAVLVKKVLPFLNFSSLSQEKCLKCFDFIYPQSTNMHVTAPSVTKFWKGYFDKNNNTASKNDNQPTSRSTKNKNT